ncbi:acetyltransferase [Paenibacillus sp. LMG 31461]|uniref:Acetyltransferase n=1 Tax=Paenibacillus plantarum TaxID=2654975 RepID=A0ABX1X5H1_9BACL|nr:DapH/DapD/GlmU-related protein [Paenibacillus plantarum]NOU63641.1 acetyltransferase [Paenibacillus plantarum]
MKHIHQTQPSLPLSSEPAISSSSHLIHSDIGAWASVGPNNKILESQLGDYTYTMDDVTINYAEVGKFTSIASHVCINPVDHPMDRVTQHHMTYRRAAYGFADGDDQEIFDWRRGSRVTIGHDVWIGHGAIVMKGVDIGTGAVVGSGAIVTKDIEPYNVVVGVPAKPLKRRFPQEVVDQLLKIAWWDWPREILEERFNELNDLSAFIRKYG